MTSLSCPAIGKNTWKEWIGFSKELFINMNMKISLKKCNFGFPKIKALGHVVSGLSLGIDQNKVAAVLKKPMPQTRKEMQSFLGFAGYHRQHIINFASKAKSLTELTKLDVVFEMTAERIAAYFLLREKLTTAPLLLFQIGNYPSNSM
jgi:hypothetical protein